MSDLKEKLAQATIGKGDGALLMPPVFDSAIEERRYVKQRLAAAFRLFAYYRFDDGLAGHITVRDPINTDCFWVNPVGIHFSQIKASQLVLIDHDGQIVEGEGLVNLAAFAIHSRIHALKPQINAVAHAHSIYGKSWSALGRKLDSITQDSCVFHDNHSLFDGFSGVVHETSEGDMIAEALGENGAIILQNHGLLTAGADINSAVGLYVQLERACEAQLLAEAAGAIKKIPDAIAEKAQAFLGSELVLWGYFQPLYQMILAKGDDFLE